MMALPEELDIQALRDSEVDLDLMAIRENLEGVVVKDGEER